MGALFRQLWHRMRKSAARELTQNAKNQKLVRTFLSSFAILVRSAVLRIACALRAACVSHGLH